MIIPTKKLSSDFELPVYGLGLWQMGGRWESDTSNDEREVAAIRAALDAGITHVDTAEGYGNGHAEQLLARAINGYDRAKLQIATKVAGHNQAYDGLMRALEGSLKRLQTDYIDLYMLHFYPPSGTDVNGTVRALDELVAQGAIKHIGVCNMSPNRFEDIQRRTKNKLVCNQVHYNVQYREAEKRGVLEHAQQNDVMLVAWRPVQKGNLPKSALVNELAAKYGKTPTQIAINWLVSQQNVVTISKTSSLEHLTENLGALDWRMEVRDIERIRTLFPDQKNVSDALPLDYETDVEV